MSERYLFIAEKPSLMKDIQSAYNKVKPLAYEAEFTCFFGHFCELQEPQQYSEEWGEWKKEVLPMIPDEFHFNVKKECQSSYDKIKRMVNTGGYDYVVNACDAGREGQAIFWTTYLHMGCKVPVKRFWASDTTVSTLAKALSNLLDESTNIDLINMKKASFYRMYFDWLVGMNFTRAITLAVHKTIPVGRVMSPTLKIVVDRHNDIANFVPKDYFEVVCDFDKYKGSWFDASKSLTSFDKKELAEDLKKKIKGKTGTITAQDTEAVTQYAPALFSLTELQKEASRTLGFTAAKTLSLAQKLYEDYKVLSYPRTESRALSTNLSKEIDKRLKAIKDIPEVSKYVDDILKDKKRIDATMSSKKYVDDKKITDHHAIIPTETVANLSAMKPDERNLYLLVVKKLVAIFMNPYVTNKTTIVTTVEGETFKTVGSVLVDYGFKKLYEASKKDDEIPDVKKGEEYVAKDLTVNSKKTQPPKPFDDGTLIDAMSNAGRTLDDAKLKTILKETAGIGTVATRDGIIEKLIKTKMLVRNGKIIDATDFGIKIIDTLKDKDIVSPALTAQWEEKLRFIEDGKLDPEDFYSNMLDYIRKETAEFDTLTATFSNNDTKVAICDCPACDGKIYESPKAFYCSNWKKDGTGCSVIFRRVLAKNKTIPASEAVKIMSGKESKPFTFVKASTNKEFTTTLIYDANSKKVIFNIPKGSNEVLGKCPICGGDVIDKGGYMRCINTDTCKFGMKYILSGANFSLDDCKDILDGKGSDYKNFSFGEARIKGFNKDKGSFDFEFKEICVGKCPICGKDVIDKKNFIECKSNSKTNPCFSLSANIKGAKFTKKDYQDILSGKETDFKKFSFGTAKVKYNKTDKKIEFIFKPNPKKGNPKK